jgi:hypothetical protein
MHLHIAIVRKVEKVKVLTLQNCINYLNILYSSKAKINCIMGHGIGKLAQGWLTTRDFFFIGKSKDASHIEGNAFRLR